MSTDGSISFRGVPPRKVWAGSAGTDAQGQAHFTFTGAGFVGDMVVVASVESGVDGIYHRCEVVSKSSSGCIVEVTRSQNTAAGGLLGIGSVPVAGAQTLAPVGVIVNVIAHEKN